MATKPKRNKATSPSRNKRGGGKSSQPVRTPTEAAATDSAGSQERTPRRGAAIRQGRPATPEEDRERQERRARERQEEIQAQKAARDARQPKGRAGHRHRAAARRG